MRTLFLLLFVLVYGHLKSQPLKYEIELQINQIVDSNLNRLKITKCIYDYSNESSIFLLEKGSLEKPLELSINLYGENKYIFIYKGDSLKVNIIHNGAFYLLDRIKINQVIINNGSVILDFFQFLTLFDEFKNAGYFDLIIDVFPIQYKSILNIKDQDLIAFSFSEPKIYSLEPSWGSEIYNQNGTILIKRYWQSSGKDYFQKEYTFIRNTDTMKIYCNCGQKANLYFKNLKFTKGEFLISTIERSNFVIVNEIFNDYSLNTIKVTGSYNKMYEQKDNMFPDIPFSLLEFILIDTQKKGIMEKLIKQ